LCTGDGSSEEAAIPMSKMLVLGLLFVAWYGTNIWFNM
jgi:hypothetical protein